MDGVRNMLKECEKFLLSFVGNQHLPNLTYSWTVMERHEVAQQVRTLLCRIAGFPDPDPGLRPRPSLSRSLVQQETKAYVSNISKIPRKNSTNLRHADPVWRPHLFRRTLSGAAPGDQIP